MTEGEFETGIKKVEAALQGSFDPKFVGYLWDYFKSHDAPHWESICSTLCRSSKSTRNLVFHDFLQVGVTERSREHQKRKLEDSRQPRQGDIQKLDIVGLAEKIAKRTGKPFHRRLADKLREESEE